MENKEIVSQTFKDGPPNSVKEKNNDKQNKNIEEMDEQDLNKLDKEALIQMIIKNKHKLIQNKNKNVPFVDDKGVMHKKEYVVSNKKKNRDWKGIDFDKV